MTELHFFGKLSLVSCGYGIGNQGAKGTP